MKAIDASRIYLINGPQSTDALSADLIGSKAANLARLARVGLRVPPALAVTTVLSREFMHRGRLPAAFRASLAGSIRQLEEVTGLTLGGRRPLLVSVRSSPPISMPGMLTTILNAGINEETVRGLIRRTGNPWLAWDAYRRFIRSFVETLAPRFAAALDRETAEHLTEAGVDGVQDLDPMALRNLVRAHVALLADTTDFSLPVDPVEQIVMAVEAVIRSWMSPRACEYRRLNQLSDHGGTGVLIQAMVFGNSGPLSGSGVGFTRNPATGASELYLDFVFNAQGEDVVGGRLPVGASELLASTLPDVWKDLQSARTMLEREFRDMQDFEFTVEDGQLFFLQSRSGKRTPWAALRIATDLVREEILDRATALERLAPYDLQTISRIVVRPGPDDAPLARATPASVGVASGSVVFDAARAKEWGSDRPVILVRSELTTDDIGGLAAAAGVLTTFGGRTSHAAVVARHLGKVCLTGCRELSVDERARTCSVGARQLQEGDVITLDGDIGLVYSGRLPVVAERPEGDLAFVESWRQMPFALQDAQRVG